MTPKVEHLLKSILKDDFEPLRKALVKLQTESVVDITELGNSLRVVPKSMLSWLSQQLAPMKRNETKEIELPWVTPDAAEGIPSVLKVTKSSQDVYKGDLIDNGSILHTFELVSIPQLAVHLISTFELYEDVAINEGAEKPQNDELFEKFKELLSQFIDSSVVKNHPQQPVININVPASAPQSLAGAPLQKTDLPPTMMVLKALKKCGSKLQKEGVMPRMPGTPRPGHRGGNTQGISKKGLVTEKTPHSDFTNKPTAGLRTPYLKMFKSAVSKHTLKKSLSLRKSEIPERCGDCGQCIDLANGVCGCFKALKPLKVRSAGDVVTLSFNNEWDEQSRIALYRTFNKKE